MLNRIIRQKKGRKAALLGLVLVGVGSVLWWGRSAAPPPTPTSRPGVVLLPEAMMVAPGVYLLGRTRPAAAYAVSTSDGLVLIDSGLESSAAEVAGQLERLGLDVRRLRAILLTHAHADHSLGAATLRARTGAKVYAGCGDARPLREGGPREAFFSIDSVPEVPLHPTTVDMELAGGERLTFGDTRFEAIATPGHSPGSVCYLLERADLRALFVGDVIQHLGPPGRGSLGTYIASLPPVYRGDARDYLDSLRRLRKLPFPDLVLPGHPRKDTPPETPRLSAERWLALLDHGIGEMELLLARYATDGAGFLDGVPKKLLPGLHYFGDVGGSAVYVLDTPKGLFVVDAPGGLPLVEFLARRFREQGWHGRPVMAVLLTSVDEKATAGLAALVRDTGCRVVVSRSGVEEVRRLCPGVKPLVAEEELEGRGWFAVEVLPLEGRGRAPVAYRARWAGKTVLFGGRIPVKMNRPEVEQLLQELGEDRQRREQYARSLDRLAGVHPDLWLPAIPCKGQNANLYDQDWAETLARNKQVVEIGP